VVVVATTMGTQKLNALEGCMNAIVGLGVESEELVVDVEKNVESKKLAAQEGVVHDKKDNPVDKVVMVATTMGKQKVNALEGCMNVVVRLGGMGSIISMVSISPEGFLPYILLPVVVIVMVVIVAVILVVVIVAIDGVVIVVMIIRVEVVVTIIGVVVVVGVSFIIKSDGKIRLPSSGSQSGDSTSLSKAS
nr:hypothetical protein [Tanacetum cinerariifolium]